MVAKQGLGARWPKGQQGLGAKVSPLGLDLVSLSGWGRGRWDGPQLPRWLGPGPQGPSAQARKAAFTRQAGRCSGGG